MGGPLLRHMIATLDSPIGWQVGQYPKRSGVATMQERAALQQQEGALELDLRAGMTGRERWRMCAIFRCSGFLCQIGSEVCTAWLQRWRMRHLLVLGLAMHLGSQVGQTCADFSVVL